jgi:protein-disulfide isomerase
MFSGKILVRFLIILLVLAAVGGAVYLALMYMPAEKEAGPADVGEQPSLTDENHDVLEKALSQKVDPVKPVSEDDHIRGDIGAPVGLIIYDDFDGPFSGEFYETVKKVTETYGGQVVVAYRHYPLRTHPKSYEAAMASECAAEQSAFWQMSDKLFKASLENGLVPTKYADYASEIGINQSGFSECMEEERYADVIEAEYDEARRFNVSGTPGSFLNGRPLSGAVPYDDYIDSQGNERPGLKSLIEDELGGPYQE